MDLYTLLTTIRDSYEKETAVRRAPEKGNEISRLLINGLNNLEGIDDLLGSEFISKGSFGQGNWAIVPWIGIFDKKHPDPKHGIYLVYLFSADHKTIYLSLNQGWEFFKERYADKNLAEDKIKAKSAELRNLLDYSEYNEKISHFSLDLHSQREHPNGYKLASILNIKYEKNDLPDNDRLMKDLNDMIKLLSDLIDSLSFDENGNYK